MNEQLTKYEFNYATFKLEPYTGVKESSGSLLKKLLHDMSDTNTESIGVIDKYKGHKGTEKRRLVHIAARFTDKGKRCYARMALLKNKAPMLWGGKDDIESIDRPEGKKFVELTNYIIDFTSENPVVMVEFNSSGPRLSDIKYYLYQVLKLNKIAKSIGYTVHLDTDIDDLEKRISNVFSINVKVKSGNLLHTKDVKWYKALLNLSETTGYKDVKMDFAYGYKKDTLGKYIKHTRGLDFARNIIDWLRQKQSNLDKIDDLKMAYTVDGKEEVLDLDFLKNKTTSVVSIPKAPQGLTNRKQFNEMVGIELNYYLATGKTHKEENDD